MTEGNRSGEGVAAEAVTVIQSLRTEVVARGTHRQPARLATVALIGRYATRQPLTHRHEVGAQPTLLAREEGAGAAEPCGHLVVDQEDAGIPQARPKAATSAASATNMPAAPCTRGSTTAATNRSRLSGKGRQRSVEPARIAVAGSADHRFEPKRIEQIGTESAGPERQRADGVSVVGVAQGEIPVPIGIAPVAPVLEGDLECLFDRGRAVGSEKENGVLDRHLVRQRLRQFDDD